MTSDHETTRGRKRAWLVSALAATLLAAGAADARAGDREHDGRGAVVARAHGGGMTGGELLGEDWALGLSGLSTPFTGTCTTLAGRVLAPHPRDDGTATCTGDTSSRVFFFFGSFCSNVEAPLFPATRAAQLACAVAADQAIEALTITVDGGRPIDIVRRRFEVSSPQRTVLLPPDNFLGVPAGYVTFTAHAWAAMVMNLRPGRHTIARAVTAPAWGGTFTATITIDIAPSH
jgi:hypothetical protein